MLPASAPLPRSRPQRSPGLVLAACMLLVAGGGASGGGASAAGDAADTIEPLPLTSIVFERAASDGAAHETLHVLDLTSGEERLLLDPARDGSGGAPIMGSSLSPDRRWVLFAAAFGLGELDRATSPDARVVWRISVDGRHLERISPPTPDLSLTGQTCRLDADCPSGQGCHPDLGQCYRGNERLRLGNPAAGPREGDTYFELGAYDFSADGISGGGWLAELAGPRGTVRHLGADAGCALVTNPSPSPVAGILLAIHSMCRDARDEGIHAWDAVSGQHQLVVPTSPGGLEIALDAPDWLADGSGFVFVARDEVVTESGAWFGAGVHAYDIATAGLVRVIPPPAPEVDIRSVAPASDGQAAVVCYVTATGTELWLLELPYTGQGTRLVPDERSCSPSW